MYTSSLGPPTCGNPQATRSNPRQVLSPRSAAGKQRLAWNSSAAPVDPLQADGTEGGLRLLHLEGQGELGSRLMMEISRVTIWVIGVFSLLTEFP